MTAAASRARRNVMSGTILVLSVSVVACLSSSPWESTSSQSDEGRKQFACDPETGACYTYTGSGDPASDFALHIGSGDFTPANGYTYMFSLQVNFGPYVGDTVAQRYGSDPFPQYRLTWCEMADSQGQVIYSSDRSSIDQLQLNLTCECLRLNSCTDAITCRDEDPDQPTPIDSQIPAPRCQ